MTPKPWLDLSVRLASVIISSRVVAYCLKSSESIAVSPIIYLICLI